MSDNEIEIDGNIIESKEDNASQLSDSITESQSETKTDDLNIEFEPLSKADKMNIESIKNAGKNTNETQEPDIEFEIDGEKFSLEPKKETNEKDLAVQDELARLREENTLLKAGKKEEQNLQQEKPPHDPINNDDITPPKPTLSEHNYDEDAFTDAMQNWIYIKNENESKAEKLKQKQEALFTEMTEKATKYRENAKNMPVADFTDMEITVMNELSVLQQEAVIYTAENPELVIYALGKSKDLRERFKQTNDPLKLAYMVGQINAKSALAPKMRTSQKLEPEIKGGTSAIKVEDPILKKLGVIFE